MRNNKNKKVCMMSYRHDKLDDRIYKKEALTLAENGYQVIHLCYGEDCEDYTTEDNIRIIQLKRLKKGSSFRSQLAVFKQLKLNDLFQEAKEIRADIYHLHDIELCKIALKLKKLPWSPKVIYDAHEPYRENLKDYWKERSKLRIILSDIPSLIAERNLLSKVDYLIATEENVASCFKKRNNQASIIYNYSYFPILAGEESNKKEYDIIYSGIITESKGLSLMIDAIRYAKTKGYGLKCLFVGGFGKQEDKIRIDDLIEREKLHDNLLFTGQLPLEELAYYYKRSKLAFCLFPLNNTNQLILPIKLFEYAAFGLPIIGSNFGHIKKIIELNNIGVCVNPHNTQSVYSAIVKLLQSPDYNKYSTNCISSVSNKYSWSFEKNKLLDIYNSLNR